jgi:hypothetical protein
MESYIVSRTACQRQLNSDPRFRRSWRRTLIAVFDSLVTEVARVQDRVANRLQAEARRPEPFGTSRAGKVTNRRGLRIVNNYEIVLRFEKSGALLVNI